MRTSHAALGSTAFFVVAPGTVVGLVPWLITRWEFHEPVAPWLPARIAGVVLIVAGLVPLVTAFVEFTRAGGTPAPPAPTGRLVVGGFNRFVRNPMYVGLVLIISGQALLFGQLGLLLYAVLVWAVTALFVRGYEEPALVRQFGSSYETYRSAVPGWIPRLRPWRP
jgi:protein-S-isoprenylcysteine O-methyltransferase Ste14